ncbi:DUF4190 domain-containing protein [Allostreptomyces psammosilenae]|uniref:DUF4190 domain-containing protein n=1 Tax=Allostreptomyces psammosilenae TaxID=1892865 RepID=A0A852ZZY4_9ACTN|nr:DUF4190 domain-containing protein [Allostreptomyces psammosilenae]NYI06780.1 hypothetical protein [Allostreptomyces psammosilenae]
MANYGNGAPNTPAGQTNGMAVAALVCAITSFLLLPIVLGPLAFVLGALANSPRRTGGQRSGIATAAMALGAVSVVVWLIFLGLATNSAS